MDNNRYHDHPEGLRALISPATYLVLHGSKAELAALHTAIEQTWVVLTTLGPDTCEPAFGCHHLHLVVVGAFDAEDLDALITEYRIQIVRATARFN